MSNEEVSFGIWGDLFPNTDEETRKAFIQFAQREIDLAEAIVVRVVVPTPPLAGSIGVWIELDREKTERELRYLVDVFLRDDLVTQRTAATTVNVSLQTINQATRDGRLRSFRNPKARNPRRGSNLVSLADVKKIWP